MTVRSVMKCRANRRRLNALCDSRLTPAEERAAHAHCDVCNACADYFVQLQQAQRAVAALGCTQPPSGLSERVATAALSFRADLETHVRLRTDEGLASLVFVLRRAAVAACACAVVATASLVALDEKDASGVFEMDTIADTNTDTDLGVDTTGDEAAAEILGLSHTQTQSQTE